MNTRVVRLTVMMGMLLFSASSSRAGQPLETESARLLKRGTLALAGGFERQASSAGTEAAAPFSLEYGLTDRIELTIEPVLYTSIQDKGFRSQTGPGDIEATLTSLVSPESPGRPAFALAGEVKVPTAHNSRIGTGKLDVSGYLISSKRMGAWDTHVNVGYTLVGHPAGVAVNNVASFGVAEELHVGNRWDVVSEVFGSTAALKESGEGGSTTSESQITPEIGGAELVGALGVRFRPYGHVAYSLGVSVDNNQAILVHPGVSLEW